MKTLLTSIVTFVAMSVSLSSAKAQQMGYPRDQALDTVAKVTAALSAHSTFECSLSGEVPQPSPEQSLNLQRIVKGAETVVRLRSGLPTYEFVRSRGTPSQTAAIVTLSQDGKSILSAVMVISDSVDVPSMFGELKTQLVPTTVSHCK